MRLAQALDFTGAPGAIRTPDPLVRSEGAEHVLGNHGVVGIAFFFPGSVLALHAGIARANVPIGCERPVQAQIYPFANHFVLGDGAPPPDLCLDGIERIAEEVLDRQVLLEPFEERFDLPAVFVEGGDRQRRPVEQVGEKNPVPAGLRVAEGHPAEGFGVSGLRLRPGQQNRRVGTQSGRRIELSRGHPGGAQMVLGANDEADLLPVPGQQPCEIPIAPADHPNRACRQRIRIEPAHVVNLAGRNADEPGEDPAQVITTWVWTAAWV